MKEEAAKKANNDGGGKDEPTGLTLRRLRDKRFRACAPHTGKDYH